MTKFDKPFARYDRLFPDDPLFQQMAEGVRAKAYLLFLAINAECYEKGFTRKLATGSLLRAEVDVLAHKLGVKSKPCVAALEEVGLVRIEGREVVLPRFFRWNPELTPAAFAVRSDKARQAATTRWSDAQQHATEHAREHANEDAWTHAQGDARKMPDRDRDRDRDASGKRLLESPPNPPRPKSAPRLGLIEIPDDEQAYLGVLEGFKGSQLSALELDAARGWWVDYSRLTAAHVAAQLDDYGLWLREHDKPRPRTLGAAVGDQLRRLNEHLADEGAPPRGFTPAGRSTQLQGIGRSIGEVVA